MPMRPKHFTDWVHAAYFETPHEEIKYMRRLLEIDDQLPIAYYVLGSSYNQLHQYDKAIPEYEKALDIYNKWDLRPVWIYNYTELGDAYHKTGQYKKEKKLYKKAEEDFPNDSDLIYMQAILAFAHNDTVTANKYVDKYISVRRDNTDPEASIMTGLADLYSDAGVLDKSEESYRKALFLEPDNSDRLNNLAGFLIDKDRNINEGLKLIDKALTLSPDNYYMLDTKGWGLYKQGKYKEALEFIEKSWDLRPIYDHDLYLHLETVKKAVAEQKNN
jgi:tetratricopeptide (TPR) repeat protein